MKRVNRLLEMLAIIQSKKLVTADQLAQQFGISTRTVYRDIQALENLRLSVTYQATKGYIQVAVRVKNNDLKLVVIPAAIKQPAVQIDNQKKNRS